MRWVKRGLWLAAWGCWAWLGWGLYRELPRNLGPAVCDLRGENRQVPLGFVGDTDLFAFQLPWDEPAKSPQLLLVDARTGEEVGVRPMPLRSRFSPGSIHFEPLRAGVLFGAAPDRRDAFEYVNIASGERRGLPSRPDAIGVVPSKGERALVVDGDFPPQPDRLMVVDLASGRELLTRRIDHGERFSHRPFFAVWRDEVLFSLEAPKGRALFEVWRVGQPSARTETIEGPKSYRQYSSISTNGRVYLGGWVKRSVAGRTRWFDIYDIERREYLTTMSDAERAAIADEDARFRSSSDITSGQVLIAFAMSGGAVLRYDAAPPRISDGLDPTAIQAILHEQPALFEVGTGRILWRPGKHDEVLAADDQVGFVVMERWHRLLPTWLSPAPIETFAYRILEGGALWFRTGTAVELEPRFYNASRTLCLKRETFTTHRLPLPVNHPLLTLCQAILALPLVLLWAALRWRRKRRMIGTKFPS